MTSQSSLQDEKHTQTQIDNNLNRHDSASWQHLLESKSLEIAVQHWLHIQCQQIEGVINGIIVLKTQEDNFSPAAYFPHKLEEIQRFTQVIDKTLKERKGIVLKTEPAANENANNIPCFHIALPIQCMNQLYGAVVLEIKPRPQPQLQSAMRQL